MIFKYSKFSEYSEYSVSIPWLPSWQPPWPHPTTVPTSAHAGASPPIETSPKRSSFDQTMIRKCINRNTEERKDKSGKSEMNEDQNHQQVLNSGASPTIETSPERSSFDQTMRMYHQQESRKT